jgi:drug/metabolite transporter (DMT)-like permease
MLAAGVAGTITALFIGEQKSFSISQVSATSTIALIYLIVLGSLVAYSAYIWLLSVRPASLVGTYAYVNPVVAVFLGWLIAGEVITTQQIIALSIVLVGVLLVNFSKEKSATETETKNSSIELQNPERSVATKVK